MSVYIVCLPHFLMTHMQLTLSKALLLSTIGMIVMTLLIPIFGKLSDYVGHNRLLCFGLIVMLFFGYGLFNLMEPNIFIIGLVMIMMAIIISLIAAPSFALLVSIFPTRVRYSGVSVVFNVSESIFAGTTPIILVSLVNTTHYYLTAGVYLSIFSLLSLLGLIWLINSNSIYNYPMEVTNERV